MTQSGRPGEATQQRLHPKSFADAILPPFEAYLHTLLPDDGRSQPLVPAMNYSLLSGGKRLRPLLCIAAARLFDTVHEVAFTPAAAVELVHAYSLIHDDLPCMDDDDLRRGRPTNHRVYGEAMALLAGDGLLTYAFEVLARTETSDAQRVEMFRTLAGAAGPYGMVAGQAADMAAATGERSSTRLAYIHTHKTGRLIQAAIDLGAILGGADAASRALLSRFGEHIGRAFQMMDDWLDVRGSAAELGKNVGHDEEMNKLTYPALFGADETRAMAQREYDMALGCLQSFGAKGDILADIAATMVLRRS